MKTATKVILAIMGLLTSASAIPGVGAAIGNAMSGFWTAHPFLTTVASAVALVFALLHVPTAMPAK